MQHVTYGIFADVDMATEAVKAIEESSSLGQRCQVILEKDKLDEGVLGLGETASSETLFLGLVVGGLLGAAAGAFAGGIQRWETLAGLAILGSFFGGVAGAIGGAGAPERTLRKLESALRTGQVLVVVEADDYADRDRADFLLHACGGKVLHKALI